MGIPLDKWLGFQAPSVLHMLKVWGCAAYALDMGQRGKFDPKVSKTVHLGYDVARGAYILCFLPHFKIAYSAHVTFNEQDFPLREHYKPDPQPFNLCEERASVPLRHSASGEAWGCARGGGNPMRIDLDGTLGPGTGFGRVSGYVQHQVSPLVYPTEAKTSDGTLGPGRGLGRVSGHRQQLERPVPLPECEKELERCIEEEQGEHSIREQPATVHSLPARANEVNGLRRSARGWKPSGACLENIAHATVELARAEAAMDEEDKHPSSLGHRTTKGKRAAEGTALANKATRDHRGKPSSCGRERLNGGEEQISALDHARWFWESIYRTSESGFCPRNHSEAMRLPQAENVRLAEINEYNSHIQNGTFGPALDPSQFAPGPALKAVWVYSRSKKDPGAFKARVVIQGFLMQQGLHFNDVHAPVPAVTSFRVFMLGVAVQGRALEHWDVKTAFLTTDMDCQIDVTLPEAFNRELDLQPEARRGTGGARFHSSRPAGRVPPDREGKPKRNSLARLDRQ